MFVSYVYGGRASGKLIFQESNLDNYLSRGDEIMEVRGFALTPELCAKSVQLNVPAFTRGKTQLSEQDVTKTRRIATLRIHVERLINRTKSYRILKGTIPISHKST